MSTPAYHWSPTPNRLLCGTATQPQPPGTIVGDAERAVVQDLEGPAGQKAAVSLVILLVLAGLLVFAYLLVATVSFDNEAARSILTGAWEWLGSHVLYLLCLAVPPSSVASAAKLVRR